MQKENFIAGIRRHPIAVAIVVLAALAGAGAGVMAYYNGWLG